MFAHTPMPATARGQGRVCPGQHTPGLACAHSGARTHTHSRAHVRARKHAQGRHLGCRPSPLAEPHFLKQVRGHLPNHCPPAWATAVFASLSNASRTLPPQTCPRPKLEPLSPTLGPRKRGSLSAAFLPAVSPPSSDECPVPGSRQQGQSVCLAVRMSDPLPPATAGLSPAWTHRPEARLLFPCEHQREPGWVSAATGDDAGPLPGAGNGPQTLVLQFCQRQKSRQAEGHVGHRGAQKG